MRLLDQVKEMLYWKQHTRNSDIYLWTEIVMKWYWNDFTEFLHVVQNNSDEDTVRHALNKFMLEVPNQDNVKRVRARYNSKGKFLPTKIEIVRKRRLNEDKWKIAMGYPTKKFAEAVHTHEGEIKQQSKML